MLDHAAPPRQIGPYLVTGMLGEGGMGVVYAAEQREPFHRRVALKLLRGGPDSDEVIRRFELERQALARMEHSSIATVFDAGTTDDGLPYFAMELVEGVPFTTWCDEHRLSTRERVRLFLPLCSAIQHAHQKGVIHRDLKPSNVLVTAQSGTPTPMVIDFGIARAVDQRIGGESMLTLTGMALGTPAYMSPEQAEGAQLDVDTRSDVYALGVMLYEVLVGALPLDPGQMGLGAFIARLLARHTLPPLPSVKLAEFPDATSTETATRRGTQPATLVRELRGDLDAIAMKAMAPERELRYQTAADLGADLERYLANEPVQARVPSRWYRAGKFVRRHPTGTTLAASIALFLVSLTTVTLVQARNVARERTVADQRRSQAEALLGSLEEMRGKLASIGQLALFDSLDNRALAYYAAVPPEELTAGELFSRSQSMSGIGQVRMESGDLDLAMRAFRKSLDQVNAVVARDTTNATWLAALGAGHFWVGNVHYLRSQLDSAAAEFDRYLVVAKRLVARDSTKPEWQLELGYAQSSLGSVLEEQGELERAVQAFRYTLDVKRRLVALDTTKLDWLTDLGVSHNTLGRAHERAGRLDSAETHYRADLAVRAAVIRREPNNAVWRERFIPAVTYLGALDLMRGRLASARILADSGYAMTRALAAVDTQNANRSRDHAVAAVQLARVRLAQGEASSAVTLAEAGRRMLEPLAARDSTNADYRTQLAIARIELARARGAMGAHAAALASVNEAERQLPGGVSLELARARAVRALLLDRVGRRQESRRAMEEALTALGSDPARDELKATAVRAFVLAGLGRTAEAGPIIARLRQTGVRASPVDWTPLR